MEAPLIFESEFLQTSCCGDGCLNQNSTDLVGRPWFLNQSSDRPRTPNSEDVECLFFKSELALTWNFADGALDWYSTRHL